MKKRRDPNQESILTILGENRLAVLRGRRLVEKARLAKARQGRRPG